MALVGIEGLDLNEVVSEDTNKETNETVIDITEVEIDNDTIYEVITSINEKVDKIDFNKLKELFYGEQREFDLYEKSVMEYQKEFTNLITEINITDITKDSTNYVIKLNSNVVEKDYDVNIINTINDVKTIINNISDVEVEYLNNVIKNLYKDYYDVNFNNINNIYIKFDNEFNNIKIKIVILYILLCLNINFKIINLF